MIGRITLRAATLVLATLAGSACQPSTPAATTSPAKTDAGSLDAGFVPAPQPLGLTITATGAGGTLTLDASNGLAIPAGLTRQLTATETFTDGTSQDVTTLIRWSSGTPSVGTVSAAGVVSATTPGNTLITATLDVFSQTFPLSVEAALASLSIGTDLSGLWVGETLSVSLVATLADGMTIDVAGTATWGTTDPGVAGISPAGVITGAGVGMTTITAQLGGLSTSALATVVATEPTIASIALGTDNNPPTLLPLRLLPGTLQALGVWATYTETGAVVNITSMTAWTWSSTDMTVATVTPGGVVAALKEGTTSISASGSGMTATLTVTVTAAIQSLSLAVLPLSLGPGTYNFPDVIATLTDTTVVDATTWATLTSNNEGVVAIDGEAVFARGMGSAVITATIGTAKASATVNVKAISSLAIVPSSVSIPVGFVDSWITAFATLSDGSVVEATGSARWETGSAAIASFGGGTANVANSPLTAASAGTTTMTARLFGGDTTASAPLTVTPAVSVDSLALAPTSATLDALSYQSFVATATLAGGSMMDVSPFVSWSFGTPTGGLMFATDFEPGTLAALAPAGSVTATAALGGSSASATITVSDATISSITVSPQPISLSAAGATQALTVKANYSDGTSSDVTPLTTWSSTDTKGTIVVVSQSSTSRATVVAEGAGTATLTAWVSPDGPYIAGAPEIAATTKVTVQ